MGEAVTLLEPRSPQASTHIPQPSYEFSTLALGGRPGAKIASGHGARSPLTPASPTQSPMLALSQARHWRIDPWLLPSS
ncbi:MAG: hypothetical protein JJU32_10340 [Phormidium sp. BM_Day4_Bin.17]|nr:hypothetical protein [Phormidium sp. BM_Day4_Bin.17]UCJ12213.1 MAG: hypothetical protein JWS08_21380 [Phormidium sp. PBR-2020]